MPFTFQAFYESTLKEYIHSDPNPVPSTDVNASMGCKGKESSPLGFRAARELPHFSPSHSRKSSSQSPAVLWMWLHGGWSRRSNLPAKRTALLHPSYPLKQRMCTSPTAWDPSEPALEVGSQIYTEVKGMFCASNFTKMPQ